MDTPSPESLRRPIRHTIWRKLVDTSVGAVLPAICFLLAAESGPDWQDGKPTTYVLLFLGEAGTLVFLPFLVPSVVAFLLVVWWPRSARIATIRFFVLTGLPQAALYSLAVAVYWFGDHLGWPLSVAAGLAASALVAVLPGWLGRGLRWIKATRGWGGLMIVTSLAGLGVLLAALSVSAAEPHAVIFFFSLLGILSAAPAWTLAVFLRRILEWRRSTYRAAGAEAPAKFARWGPRAVWFWTWAVAWRTAGARSLADYASLPPTPSDCFVATIAAKGHPRLVRSQVSYADDRLLRVTPQLRRLKAFEVLLAQGFPRAHRLLRRAYDVVGPRLAARVSNRWRADVTWLLLKPAEWAAVLGIRLAAGRDAPRHVERIWPRSE